MTNSIFIRSLFACFSCTISLQAQEITDPVAAPVQVISLSDTEIPQDGIYRITEIAPEFPGGQDSLQRFVSENLIYPKSSIELHEQGKVYVEFVVELDGSISSIQVLRGASKSLDQEAIRIISSMPNWIPAVHKGKTVRAYSILPIYFKLDK